jgi:hypothetical protein
MFCSLHTASDMIEQIQVSISSKHSKVSVLIMDWRVECSTVRVAGK